jgi:hypothetical protein
MGNHPCPDDSRPGVDERSFEQKPIYSALTAIFHSIKEKWINAVITFVTQG